MHTHFTVSLTATHYCLYVQYYTNNTVTQLCLISSNNTVTTSTRTTTITVYHSTTKDLLHNRTNTKIHDTIIILLVIHVCVCVIQML